MHLYGVTGGIASGKSLVSAALARLGCPVIDADVIAREVVQVGKPAWKLIVGHFGVEVLQRSGELDRPKLAAIVFADSGKRRLLNMCTHPYIRRAMMWSVLMHFLRGQPFVVLVSPLLFESGQLLWLLNKTVVVNCTAEQQLERLMSRDNLSQEEALQRVNAQMSLSVKCQRADVVIDNAGNRAATLQRVEALWTDMRRLSVHRWLLRWIALLLLLLSLCFFYYFNKL